MTEIIKTDKQPNEIAIEINAIKRKTAQDVIQSAIEIGRLLCEAKAQLEHGQWGAWLEENVSYSTTNANNMMRLYKEYRKQDQLDFFGDNGVDIFEGLNLSQAIALLGLPQSERREFVETHDMQEMSVRDIQSAIKEKQDAEKRAAEAEGKLEAFESRAFEAERSADELQEKLSEAEENAKKLRAELDELLAKPAPTVSDEEIAKIKKEAAVAAEEKAKKKIDSLKKSLEDEKKKTATASENAKKDAEKSFEEERAKIIEECKKQADAEAQKKIDSLEAKLKEAQIAASPHLSTLKVLMGELQDVYRKMIATVEAAETEDAQQGASLRAAMMKLVEAMAEQIKPE